MRKHKHDFSWQVCHNPQCPLFNIKGAGNIKFHAHCKGSEIHELKCVRCGRFFSENRGTAFFHLKLPRQKIVLVVKLLVEGNGTRGTARIAGVHRDTVTSILNRVSEHLEKLDQGFLKDLEAKEIQLDELYAFVKKRNAAVKKRRKA